MPRNLSDAIWFSDFLPRMAAQNIPPEDRILLTHRLLQDHTTHQDSSGDQEWPVRMSRGNHPSLCCDEPRDQDDESSSIIADSMIAPSVVREITARFRRAAQVRDRGLSAGSSPTKSSRDHQGHACAHGRADLLSTSVRDLRAPRSRSSSSPRCGGKSISVDRHTPLVAMSPSR